MAETTDRGEADGARRTGYADSKSCVDKRTVWAPEPAERAPSVPSVGARSAGFVFAASEASATYPPIVLG